MGFSTNAVISRPVSVLMEYALPYHLFIMCLCYLVLPLCIVSMHLTRCVLRHVVCIFFLCFFNFLFSKLQFKRCLQCFDAVGWAAGMASGL